MSVYNDSEGVNARGVAVLPLDLDDHFDLQEHTLASPLVRHRQPRIASVFFRSSSEIKRQAPGFPAEEEHRPRPRAARSFSSFIS
jgi:hypothetical protein